MIGETRSKENKKDEEDISIISDDRTCFLS